MVKIPKRLKIGKIYPHTFAKSHNYKTVDECNCFSHKRETGKTTPVKVWGFIEQKVNKSPFYVKAISDRFLDNRL